MIRLGVVSSANAVLNAGARDSKSAAVASAAPQTIQVQLDPLSGCGACSASGGCAVQLLCVANAPLIVDCQLSDGVAVSVGDRVQVRLAEPGSEWLGIVASTYLSPTIGMIAGVLAGFWSAHAFDMRQFSESLSLGGFVVGLTGGLIAWSKNNEKFVQMRHVGENRVQLHKVIPVTQGYPREVI